MAAAGVSSVPRDIASLSLGPKTQTRGTQTEDALTRCPHCQGAIYRGALGSNVASFHEAAAPSSSASGAVSLAEKVQLQEDKESLVRDVFSGILFIMREKISYFSTQVPDRSFTIMELEQAKMLAHRQMIWCAYSCIEPERLKLLMQGVGPLVEEFQNVSTVRQQLSLQRRILSTVFEEVSVAVFIFILNSSLKSLFDFDLITEEEQEIIKSISFDFEVTLKGEDDRVILFRDEDFLEAVDALMIQLIKLDTAIANN